MGSYYRTQKEIMRALIKIVETSRSNKTTLDLNKLKFQILLNYEFSDKGVDKLLRLIQSEYGFEIKKDVLSWEGL